MSVERMNECVNETLVVILILLGEFYRRNDFDLSYQRTSEETDFSGRGNKYNLKMLQNSKVCPGNGQKFSMNEMLTLLRKRKVLGTEVG